MLIEAQNTRQRVSLFDAKWGPVSTLHRFGKSKFALQVNAQDNHVRSPQTILCHPASSASAARMPETAARATL
jgi:hypothetical protein